MRLTNHPQTELLLIACLIIWAPTFAQAQQLKFKKCDPNKLPLQLAGQDDKPQDIDFKCGNTGCHKSDANDRQNAAKNNYCAPTNKIAPVSRNTLKALQLAVNKMPSIPRRVPPESRQKLRKINLGGGKKLGEGDVVRFVGFVLDARHSNVSDEEPLTGGNGESVQCNLLGCVYNDIHIELSGVKNDHDRCRAVTAEIIPHYRPAAWELFDSPDYADFLREHPIRVTGQLFFDGSHVACEKGQPGVFFSEGEKKTDFPRISLWEIHPIYAIDVCKETTKEACAADPSAWIPFTSLKSHLGLNTVRPAEKCKATTTTPVSKCPGFSP